MKKITFTSLGFASVLLPAVALAQNFNYIDRFTSKGQQWLTLAITIIMVLMTIWFLIAVFNFIREKKPENLKDRRRQVINGLIGLFVAVGVWGIIHIASGVFGVNTNQQSPNIPCPPGYDYNATTGVCQ
ncbi:MAG TPA: hypothetical protein VG982_00135 [Candidatus Paceibacterota bacterium]|jgi:hypothetical protein|nr:hypothetical protein [Candidatus Paceibacterota bacterium]